MARRVATLSLFCRSCLHFGLSCILLLHKQRSSFHLALHSCWTRPHFAAALRLSRNDRLDALLAGVILADVAAGLISNHPSSCKLDNLLLSF